MKIVHIQSILPKEDVIALKEKSGESSIKDAISKAVYHYLACNEKPLQCNEKQQNDDATGKYLEKKRYG